MSADKHDEKYGSDVEAASPGTASPIEDIELGEGGLHRNLKGRHMQMIAIGGSIGAGLFVGSGGALSSGGPASLVIDFIIIGFMLLLTVNALGELAGKFATESIPVCAQPNVS
jgi:amino acid transporter